jgi:large subunit ribosomal protein L10
MPRPEKVAAVEEIKELMSGSSAVFLSEYRGLTVPQQQVLRSALRDAGASYKVVKMTLANIAAKELGHEEFAAEMNGPTAMTFAEADAAAAAKALADFAADHEIFVLKAGLLGTDFMAPERVGELAKLPSRDVLLAKIAGALQAPMVKAAGMFASFTRDMAGMMSQLLEKKEAEAPADGSDGAVEAPIDEPVADEAPAVEEVAEEVTEEAAEAVSEEAPAEEVTEVVADAVAEEAPAEEAPEETAEEVVAEVEDTETAEEPESADTAEEE